MHSKINLGPSIRCAKEIRHPPGRTLNREKDEVVRNAVVDQPLDMESKADQRRTHEHPVDRLLYQPLLFFRETYAIKGLKIDRRRQLVIQQEH